MGDCQNTTSACTGNPPPTTTTPDLPPQPAAETAKISSQGTAPIIVPMGFAAQLRAVQEAQQEQAERIAKLEQENADLKDFEKKIIDLAARVQALEEREAYRASRRTEAVSQLSNMRTLHQEADNGFQQRTADMQPDDLEGMLGAYGIMLTTAMNNHQRMLGQMRANGQFPAYTTPVPQTRQVLAPVQMLRAYPPAYSEHGFCRAHNIPYCCRVCGK
ncbi:hypothetical protein J4E93_005285 [Alternaria ventricosa]|uniref:uncharacterized protein n=1 Tax=Alternaria ventricosa TaxID=1187951 RepID=UPI0020C47415|nr:uncharacterized protein J4E93_005285 [Alternaria ventricosa]KAI4645707.1 hypothetical protein J4E93_005285 [Alternaria ventricosa]